ncbi:MAG: hypothetical protein LBR06_03620 [Bacteroidales bacterium]|jgi:hypothetical protein|nr:hypothetical protein [Bacteroidales bacterium]
MRAFFEALYRTDGWHIFRFFVGVTVLAFAYMAVQRILFPDDSLLPFPRSRKLKLSLSGDKVFRPDVITLSIVNRSSGDIDIDAPVIIFRKLWSFRKFKLTGINKAVIYPLYLEAGKMHRLPIRLDAFHEYDRSLRRYYWCKILLFDTAGRRYSSPYLTLRRSLFS